MECFIFAEHIESALKAAGVQLYKDFPSSLPDWMLTGTMLYEPPGQNLENNPLADALRKAGIFESAVVINPEVWPFKPDVWVLEVGERYPPSEKLGFEPEGVGGEQYESLRK